MSVINSPYAPGVIDQFLSELRTVLMASKSINLRFQEGVREVPTSDAYKKFERTGDRTCVIEILGVQEEKTINQMREDKGLPPMPVSEIIGG